jgi:endonuclease YncB( thermonuclease family)
MAFKKQWFWRSVLAGCLGVGFTAVSVDLPAWAGYKVCSVQEGDSFRLCNGDRVRMQGIDAPELGQNEGAHARDYLRSLILYKDVSLTCRGRSYNRRVCRVSSGRKDIEREMVLSGWAYDYPEYSRGRYQKAELQAKKAQRGLWRDPANIKPSAWRATHRTSHAMDDSGWE